MTKDITTFVFLISFSFLCAQNRAIPVDTLVKTTHNTTVKGQNIETKLKIKSNANKKETGFCR